MGIFQSILPCYGIQRQDDAIERKFSSASSRQQYLIIEQLRESQKKKRAKPKEIRKQRAHKILPIAINAKFTDPPTAEREDAGKRIMGMGALRKLSAENRALEKAEKNLAEEHNLKSALTHPTILKFLKAFMIAQGTDNTLDFYLDVVEIRGLQRSRYKKGTPLYLSLLLLLIRYILFYFIESILSTPFHSVLLHLILFCSV